MPAWLGALLGPLIEWGGRLLVLHKAKQAGRTEAEKEVAEDALERIEDARTARRGAAGDDGLRKRSLRD